MYKNLTAWSRMNMGQRADAEVLVDLTLRPAELCACVLD